MRAWWLGSLGVVVLAAVGGACSSKSSGGTTTPGDDGGGGPQPITFSPAGCAYRVYAPETWAFTDFAPDDTSALDAASAAPARVRIGLGGATTAGQPGYADPSTTAAFTWETKGANHAAKVKLGSDPGSLTDVHAGFSWTTPQPTAGIGADEPATYMHEVHVCGLTPGKTYYYQVGGGPAGAEVWSATQSFTTVPTTGKVTVGLLGDARDQVSTWQLVNMRLRDAGANVLLVSGDMVDFGTQASAYTKWLDAIWHDPSDATKFLTLGQTMLVPIAGNHENEAVRFFGNFAIPGDGPYAKKFASFNVGNTHFVMLDDEQIATVDAPTDESKAHLAWLDADLAKANADRAAHPFIVAISHRALVSSSKHAGDMDVLQARAALMPIFDKYAVDMVVNGHDHEYERSNPVKAGNPPNGPVSVQATGTVYMIAAGAGADPYEVGTGMVDYRKATTKFGPGTPYLGCYAVAELQDKTFKVTAYGLKATGPDDVIDTFTLTH
jgi:acid phosphatase type 7